MQRVALNLIAMKWTREEADLFVEVCRQMAAKTPFSMVQIAELYYREIVNNYKTKKEILGLMEHILVITTRELKEIGHAMQYAQNWAHGTTGHNQLMLIAKTYEYLGFYFDEKGDLKIPDKVRVEDNAPSR